MIYFRLGKWQILDRIGFSITALMKACTVAVLRHKVTEYDVLWKQNHTPKFPYVWVYENIYAGQMCNSELAYVSLNLYMMAVR